MNKDKHWTYRKQDDEWENDSFNTKNEAIKAAMELQTENTIYIGQLHWSPNGPWYDVKNQEKINLAIKKDKFKYVER